jgi:hypothetical protein
MLKLTRQRKVFLGILGVGLAALAVDRLADNSGPAKASASEYAIERPAPGAAMMATPMPALPGTPQSVEPPQARVSLAERLETAREAQQATDSELRDIFQPPPWQAVKPTAPGIGVAAVAAPTPAQAFERAHKHLGVKTGSKAVARVDDKYLTVGQSFDGFTLRSVGARSAVFQKDGVEVVLAMAVPQGEGPK